MLQREQKENLFSCYDGEKSARQVERSNLQLLWWRIHGASAMLHLWLWRPLDPVLWLLFP